jgi:hypothetical protein
MTDPEHQANDSPPRPQASGDQREIAPPKVKRTTVWWIVSIVFHVMAISAIVYFTPLRKWLWPETQKVAEERIDQSDVDSAVEALFELYTTRMVDHNTKLHEILVEMHRLKGVKFTELQRVDKDRDWVVLVDHKPAEKPVPGKPEVVDKDIPELYVLARQGEEDIVEEFENIRAYELSQIQQLPLSKAISVTELAIPDRPEINAHNFRREIYRMEDGTYDALKREMNRVHVETSKMVSACQRLLDLAKGVAGEDTSASAIQWDMEGTPVTTGSGGVDESGRPYQGPVLLPHEIFAQKGESFSLDIDADLRFGNKLGPDGKQGGWMSINSWWTIGPFSHPGRARPEDLDRVYPPEATIDLDAQYIGKGGRRLEWKYLQTNYDRIQPFVRDTGRYCIWYFYTEIYSEKDQTLLVSFGSDDYSVAWLAWPGEQKGRVIRRSGKTPQPWRRFGPDCFRTVTFKKGYNRMLIKLENAGGTTGFSVLINLDPAMVP